MQHSVFIFSDLCLIGFNELKKIVSAEQRGGTCF